MTTTLRKRIVTQVSMRLDEAHATCMQVKDLAGLRPRTIQDHTCFHGYFRSYLSTLGLADPKVEDVTVDICRGYIGYLKNERTKSTRDDINGGSKITIGLSPVTINIRLRAYKAQWNFYVREGYATCNPWDSIPLLKTDEEEIHVFSREHVSKLLTAPDRSKFVGYRNYVLILTLIDTGCRISELLMVNERDVDLEAGVLCIGGHSAKGRRARQVPLSTTVCECIRKLCSENAALPLREPALFISVSGRRFTPSDAREFLRKCEKSLGISGVRVSPHTFRHTFAREFLASGGSLPALQQILGHRQLSTTQRYVRVPISELKRQHSMYSPLRKK